MKKPEGALVHVERKTGKDWPTPGGHYWLDADDLRQAFALPTDMLGGFLLARLRSDKREQLPGVSAIHFTPGSEEAFLVDAKAWLAKFVDTPQVRTPLTREHLLRWAKDWVVKSPTHKESAGWDETKATTIYKDVPNTPAYVLATILQTYAAAQYGDYSFLRCPRDHSRPVLGRLQRLSALHRTGSPRRDRDRTGRSGKQPLRVHRSRRLAGGTRS